MSEANDRLPYRSSALPRRGPLRWPGGKRVALMLTFNMEYWDVVKDSDAPYYAGGPAILPDLLPGNVPDWPNFTWREYGQRTGIWRQIRLFDEMQVPAGVTINAKTALRLPELVQAANERGWEIIAHNYEQGELLSVVAQDPDVERDIIARTLRVYREAVGRPARGWLSSSLRGTFNTPTILAENGLSFYCDLMNDDQPYMLTTPAGPIVAVPYSNEINDFTLLTRRGHTTDQFRDVLIEELRTLLQEAEELDTGLIMNVGLHPHVSGRAYRVRALREFLQFAREQAGVWFATREKIVEAYLPQADTHIPGQLQAVSEAAE